MAQRTSDSLAQSVHAQDLVQLSVAGIRGKHKVECKLSIFVIVAFGVAIGDAATLMTSMLYKLVGVEFCFIGEDRVRRKVRPEGTDGSTQTVSTTDYLLSRNEDMVIFDCLESSD